MAEPSATPSACWVTSASWRSSSPSWSARWSCSSCSSGSRCAPARAASRRACSTAPACGPVPVTDCYSERGARASRARPHNLHVVVEPTLRSWEAIFAERTRAGRRGAAQILAMAGAKDVISFARGFPDPLTFPGAALAEILRELADRGDASPFQYSPDRRAAWPARLRIRPPRAPGGRRRARAAHAHERARRAMELIGKASTEATACRRGADLPGAIMAFRASRPSSKASRSTRTGSPWTSSSGGSPPARRRSSYTIPDYENPPA